MSSMLNIWNKSLTPEEQQRARHVLRGNLVEELEVAHDDTEVLCTAWIQAMDENFPVSLEFLTTQ